MREIGDDADAVRPTDAHPDADDDFGAVERSETGIEVGSRAEQARKCGRQIERESFSRRDAGGIRFGEFDDALAYGGHLGEGFRENRRNDVAAESRLERDHPMFAVELQTDRVTGETEAQAGGEARTPITSAFAGG